MYESERFPLCCLPSFCAEGAIVMIRVIVHESLMSVSACACQTDSVPVSGREVGKEVGKWIL